MLSPKKLLENARNRISKRENWTDGKFARRADNRPTSALDPDATCWCAIGALAAEAGYDAEAFNDVPYNEAENRRAPNWVAAMTALASVSPKYAPGYHNLSDTSSRYDAVYTANDTLGHERALQMFDDAIASLRGE